MNSTVAIANAKQAPNTATSDDVSTSIAMENELTVNPQSLAQPAAAPVPIPPPKSPGAPESTYQPSQPALNRHARAPATAKSQKSPQPCRSPDKYSAASPPPGSTRSSAAPRKPSSRIPAPSSA